ncbi:sulfurtransferase TusA [Carnimonas bestiolae]|uniref:sulfurtransferase TusA n=1 Tax=Carnimonas bestiolae TaxID=3402172 RepID=UPI003EDC7EE5
MSDTPTPHDVLDTQGLYCPEPIMMMHNKVRELQSGQWLEVVATDPATQRDIPQFCAFLGHRLANQTEQDGVFRYLIEIG